ncbi:YezD family protein [Luteolibacter yonseiensis]|uniref:YezD family protein n=1 Tax=Luteolibacter yonseiensis TaxID=1144680 RepID=A0A934VBV9_9BACT|nr:YezD family protein [Luteolibacter yonseiensis]MBK1815844.1 YezD family protein [Luteolibacter yonseiensis]
MSSTITEHPVPTDTQADWVEIVRKNVGNLRFGSVQITVHDGRVTQVESIEKTRFIANEAAPTNS